MERWRKRWRCNGRSNRELGDGKKRMQGCKRDERGKMRRLRITRERNEREGLEEDIEDKSTKWIKRTNGRLEKADKTKQQK